MSNPAAAESDTRWSIMDLFTLLLCALIFFVWPVTGAWKAATNHHDVQDDRKEVAWLSGVGVVLYVVVGGLCYFELWVLTAIAVFVYCVATFFRGFVHITAEGDDD